VLTIEVNQAFTNKNVNSVYLRVAITEPILIACIDGASFSEIYLGVQKIISTTTQLVVRNYLFHLINSLLVSYKGVMKMYFVTPRGLDVLEIIYYQRERSSANYTDLTLKLE
jgi:hypothetical protein